MGLPMPSDLAASSGAANPLAPFMVPPMAAGVSGAARQSDAMPDMPSDINVEEARYCFHDTLHPMAYGIIIHHAGQQFPAKALCLSTCVSFGA